MKVKDTPGELSRPEHPFEERWGLAQARYKGTINTFARNFVNQIPGFDVEDIEQELLVVLWKTVMGYDPDRGASFNSLFQGNAQRRCITLVRSASTMKRTANLTSLDIDAISRAVDDIMNEADAESTALDRIAIQEYVREYGEEVLSGAFARQIRRNIAETA